LRVVLDTNAVVSAILFEHRSLSWLRTYWKAGRFTPLIDRVCIDELVRVLTHPRFALQPGDITSLLEDYLPHTEVVDADAAPPSDLPRCRDPQDRTFLLLASAGRADVLVSGDRALLQLAGSTPFEIEPPARYKARFP